jgi:hypothetical protein
MGSLPIRAYEKGLRRYIVRGPAGEPLEVACESLKSPIALAIDVYLF